MGIYDIYYVHGLNIHNVTSPSERCCVLCDMGGDGPHVEREVWDVWE